MEERETSISNVAYHEEKRPYLCENMSKQ